MPLSKCYLFQGLSQSQMGRVAAIAREMPIHKGQSLFCEGQEAGEVYVLKNGAVELMMTVAQNFDIPVSVLREPGGCFGTSALTAPRVYSLSARCMDDGSLLVIGVAELRKLMEEDRDLGFRIMTNLAGNLRDRLKETREELKVHFRTLFQSIHS